MGNLEVIMFKDKPSCSECFNAIGTEFKRNKLNEIICPYCEAPLMQKTFDLLEKNEVLKK